VPICGRRRVDSAVTQFNGEHTNWVETDVYQEAKAPAALSRIQWRSTTQWRKHLSRVHIIMCTTHIFLCGAKSMCALHYTLYQLYSRPLWRKYMNALGVSLAAGIAVKDSRNCLASDTHTRTRALLADLCNVDVYLTHKYAHHG
jgi:hypothetical protein